MSATGRVGSTGRSHDASNESAPPCYYFMGGYCRYGDDCHYSHILEPDEHSDGNDVPAEPSGTIPNNWIDAPVFVPNAKRNLSNQTNCNNSSTLTNKATYSDVTFGNLEKTLDNNNALDFASIEEICPYEGPCPNGVYCEYSLHYELCEMCNQYCLHPTNVEERRNHIKECLRHHEQAMELSFAIARSKDKTCGICFETVIEKLNENRFGILPNCCHSFCLECIRKWRQAKQFKHNITRSCPECRIASDYVCPSSFWVDTKEDKDKLLNDYRAALGHKDCKYFKKGEGKCPFGDKCFYKHTLPNGGTVNVGYPNCTRKIYRSTEGLMDLLDVRLYLWEYIDQRDFLSLISSVSNDSSTDAN